MKNQLLLPILSLFLAFACSTKEESEVQKPLSEQNLEFEIYDSLVVDFLGNLYLTDISSNGESFLLIDQKTDSVFIADSEGTIKSRFMRKGDGPGNYRDTRFNPPLFLTDNEIIIPAWKGFYIYSPSGDFLRSHELDFNPTSSLLDLYNNKMAVLGNQVFFPWEGRNADEIGVEGKKFQLATKRLEKLDLSTGKFTSVLPFPNESKYKSEEKSYLNINYTTRAASLGDTIFVVFRNEPKIFAYHFNQMEIPAKVYTVPFEEFVEKAPKNSEKFGQYEMKDVYSGSINQIIPLGNSEFLINYTRGLTDEEYDQIFSEAGGMNDEFYSQMRQINTFGWILFVGKSISNMINHSSELGYSIKFISKDEIWFTPNYSEVEKDYVVFYKTRLISK